MKEQAIQTKILDWLHARGFWVIKTIVTNRKGVPDIISLSPDGKFVAIEVKAGSNKASKLQVHHIEQILNRGGIAMVAYSVEEVAAVLGHYPTVEKVVHFSRGTPLL
jgi:Holliday junction resolvase